VHPVALRRIWLGHPNNLDVLESDNSTIKAAEVVVFVRETFVKAKGRYFITQLILSRLLECFGMYMDPKRRTILLWLDDVWAHFRSI
jgi:hypothetical protein